MPNYRVLSAAEQVANFLREDLLKGVWSGTMPGGDRLGAELGVIRDHSLSAEWAKAQDEGLS